MQPICVSKIATCGNKDSSGENVFSVGGYIHFAFHFVIYFVGFKQSTYCYRCFMLWIKRIIIWGKKLQQYVIESILLCQFFQVSKSDYKNLLFWMISIIVFLVKITATLWVIYISFLQINSCLLFQAKTKLFPALLLYDEDCEY